MDTAELSVFATDSMITSVLNCDEKTDIIDWNILNTGTEPFDIILQIPEDKLEQWSPMTILMINQLVRTLERRDEKTSSLGKTLPTTLVMLDEFARLGKISSIKCGLATLRSRGVCFSMFIQGLSQLDSVYGQNAYKEFIDCCRYKVILNIGDSSEQEYFSKLSGNKSVFRSSIGRNTDIYGNITGYSQQVSENIEPNIEPVEFGKLKDVVLFTPQDGHYKIQKYPYFEWSNHNYIPSGSYGQPFYQNTYCQYDYGYSDNYSRRRMF